MFVRNFLNQIQEGNLKKIKKWEGGPLVELLEFELFLLNFLKNNYFLKFFRIF